MNNNAISLLHNKKMPSFKRSFVVGLLVFFGVIVLNFSGLTQTTKTAVTGNWNTAATWSPSGVPASTDSVVIPNGVTVTADASLTCAAVTFSGASATLSVNTGITLTVTRRVTLNMVSATSTTATISGLGAVSAGSVVVGGGNVTTGNANTTSTLTVTISTLSTSGNIAIYCGGVKSGATSYTYNSIFSFSSGSTNATIGGQISTISNAPANPYAGSPNCTFTTGTFSGNLNLSNI